MSRRLALAVLALAPLLAAWGTPSHQIRYSRERGGSCTAMIPYYGPDKLWIGHVAGGRSLDASSERDLIDWRVADSCFFVRQDCETFVQRVTRGWPLKPGLASCQPLAGSVAKLSPGARGPLKR